MKNLPAFRKQRMEDGRQKSVKIRVNPWLLLCFRCLFAANSVIGLKKERADTEVCPHKESNLCSSAGLLHLLRNFGNGFSRCGGGYRGGGVRASMMKLRGVVAFL